MATQERYQNSVLRERWTNATQPGDPTPAGYTAWDAAGTVTTTRALTGTEAAQLATADTGTAASTNQAAIQQQAQSALAGNRAYLAIASPTSAQVAAQVRALTQQTQALIRLGLQQFDATN